MLLPKNGQSCSFRSKGHVQAMPIGGGNMAIRSATDVFSEWATKNKDEGMERGHAASVKAMLEMALPELPTPYTAVDLGCGNGWVCRLLEQREECSHVVGVDGSDVMIEKAENRDKVNSILLNCLNGGQKGPLISFIQWNFCITLRTQQQC